MFWLRRSFLFALAFAFIGGVGNLGLAQILIDNGLAPDEEGFFQVHVGDAGESSEVDLTARRVDDGELVTTDVAYAYSAYATTGSGGFFLDAISGPTLVGDSVISSGSFVGSNSNTIEWTVTSGIPSGEVQYTNTFQFSAEAGTTLGEISLFQYLDQDVFSPGDDILFSRGSAAGNNLQVFTVDGETGIGVSQSGAFSEAQGLENASFAGWAADEYDALQPQIIADSLVYSPSGEINETALPMTTSGIISGDVFGPNDVVSALGWSVDPNASEATIVTTLGGVPDITEINFAPVADDLVAVVDEGDFVSILLDGTDPDGDPVSVSLLDFSGSPAIAPTFDSVSGRFEWDSTGSIPGEYLATFQVTDPGGLFDVGVAAISVQAIPEPSSIALLGCSILGAFVQRRRRS